MAAAVTGMIAVEPDHFRYGHTPEDCPCPYSHLASDLVESTGAAGHLELLWDKWEDDAYKAMVQWPDGTKELFELCWDVDGVYLGSKRDGEWNGGHPRRNETYPRRASYERTSTTKEET